MTKETRLRPTFVKRKPRVAEPWRDDSETEDWDDREDASGAPNFPAEAWDEISDDNEPIFEDGLAEDDDHEPRTGEDT